MSAGAVAGAMAQVGRDAQARGPSARTTIAIEASERNVTLDALRAVAVVGVVWIHVAARVPGVGGASASALGRFAVPFFTAAAVYFAVTSLAARPRTARAYFRARLVRLYLPFFAWTCIYLAARAFSGEGKNPLSLGRFLWVGGAYHLWFLPFILVATSVAFPVAPFISRPRAAAHIAIGALACGVLAAALRLRTELPADAGAALLTLALWWDASPAVFGGIFLAAARAGKWSECFWGNRWAVLGLAVATASTGVAAAGGSAVIWSNLAGVALLAAGLAMQRRGSNTGAARVAAALGGLSLGVYLTHTLFVEGCRLAAVRWLGREVVTTVSYASAVTAVSILCAGALTWAMRRGRATRWLVA